MISKFRQTVDIKTPAVVVYHIHHENKSFHTTNFLHKNDPLKPTTTQRSKMDRTVGRTGRSVSHVLRIFIQGNLEILNFQCHSENEVTALIKVTSHCHSRTGINRSKFTIIWQ